MSTQSLQTTTTPARSDLAAPAVARMRPRPYLVHGRILSAGAAMWAVATAFTGVDPDDSTTELLVFGVGSGAFQIGLLALLRVLWRSEALGSGRIARSVLRVEALFVTLAIGSTLVDMFGISDLTKPGWILLDAFWPFSMLGMFLIGVRIAVAGRWRGASRFWPMVAESWVVVTLPTLGLFGYTAAGIVSCVHLLVGYTVLGALVSRKES